MDGRLIDRLIWISIGAAGIAVTGWVLATDFTFRLSSLKTPLAYCTGVGVLAYIYTVWRPDERIATTLTALIQTIIYTGVAAPLSYLSASLGLPFWDETFHQWDLALGLEWRDFLNWANAHPTLTWILSLSYQSIMFQMILLIGLLGLTGRTRLLRVYTGAVVTTGLITVVISGLMPAMAMFVHAGLTPADYPNIKPVASAVHVQPILALRDGTLRELVALSFEGIITFPSYHAALAVVFMRAFWGLPWLRWPGQVLNVAMLVATPIDGGHHFIDVFAGIALAIVVLVLLERLADLKQPSRVAAQPAPVPGHVQAGAA
ncbi:MAG TPA: phosphatase PAP2 family protein [Microvirga sp.]|jgi:hypothetical protein|nr:phosphatase PAP2 family protein [Microvirga sp.]